MSRFTVHETTTIEAPIEEVFSKVAQFETWQQWSPWLVPDPDTKITLEGPSASVGATYRWDSEICGQGSIEHREVQSPDRVVQHLQIIKPFRSASKVSFEFERDGDATMVHWIMQGKWPWFLFWMKSQMVMLIGKDYERGLKRLKSFVETGSIPATVEIESGLIRPDKTTLIGVRRHCHWDNIEPTVAEALALTEDRIQATGIHTANMVMTVYENVDLKNQTYDFLTGYIVDAETPTPDGLVKHTVGGQSCIHLRHRGSYRFLDDSWTAIYRIAEGRKLKVDSVPAFEVNRNLPDSTAEENLITDLYLPVRE